MYFLERIHTYLGRSCNCSCCTSTCSYCLGLVFLERPHESILVLGSLETTVAKLRARVDELQLNRLERLSLGVDQQGLSQSQNPFLGAHAAPLDHDEVLLYLAVVGETTHRIDRLVCQVVARRCIVLHKLKCNSSFIPTIRNPKNPQGVLPFHPWCEIRP